MIQIHLDSISPYTNLLGLRGRTWFVSGKFLLALKPVLAKLMYSWDISVTQQLMDSEVVGLLKEKGKRY